MQKAICKICGSENELREKHARPTCFNCDNDIDVTNAYTSPKLINSPNATETSELSEQGRLELKRRLKIVRIIYCVLWLMMALLVITRLTTSFPENVLEHLMVMCFGLLLIMQARIDSKKGTSYLGSGLGNITKRNDSFKSWIFYVYLIGTVLLLAGIVLLGIKLLNQNSF